MADVEAPGGEKWEHLKSGGKQWQATPKDAAYQSHTSRLTELWSLPRPAQGLNTNNNNNNNNNILPKRPGYMAFIGSCNKRIAKGHKAGRGEKLPYDVMELEARSNAEWLSELVRHVMN